MRLIVGTYRKRAFIETCLQSVDEHILGVDDIVFIDDSGDPEHREWLANYGTVIPVGPKQCGYTPAMKQVCAAADGQPCMFLEEDFTFRDDVYLDELAELLYHRPYLAQVALLRGPHFPIEHEHGGLIEALQAKGHQFTDVVGLIEHTACFTCNPAVWRGEVFAAGWPNGRWTEEIKGRDLVRQGYRFAYLPGIRIDHSGTREGFGY